MLFELSGGDMPDIFWDGVVPLSSLLSSKTKKEAVILGNNKDATFLTINPIKFMLPFFDPVVRDYDWFRGRSNQLAEVTISDK